MSTLRNKEVRRSRSRAVALLAAAVLAASGVSVAEAALTTPACLAKKLKEWGKLRNCQAKENAKALQAKPADPAKCETKFQEKFAKITEQATEAAIACRYGDNGDGTVTDYDTGLQWEQKTGAVPNPPFAGFCVSGDVHCVNNTYDWSEAMGFADTSADGSTLTTCFSGHCDWRLPKVVELRTILLEPHPCGTSPCIDPIFGPTVAASYWSATTHAALPSDAWVVSFGTGNVLIAGKSGPRNVRAVRGGL